MYTLQGRLSVSRQRTWGILCSPLCTQPRETARCRGDKRWRASCNSCGPGSWCRVELGGRQRSWTVILFLEGKKEFCYFFWKMFFVCVEFCRIVVCIRHVPQCMCWWMYRVGFKRISFTLGESHYHSCQCLYLHKGQMNSTMMLKALRVYNDTWQAALWEMSPSHIDTWPR
jgi:hypothetical protein